MIKYKYTGKQMMAFTLPETGEHILTEGNTYDLPEGNDHIKNLEQTGYLVRENENTKSSKANQPKKTTK